MVIFIPKYVFRVIFKGGILGDVWGNPYLNSTTVLFNDDSDINLFDLTIVINTQQHFLAR